MQVLTIGYTNHFGEDTNILMLLKLVSLLRLENMRQRIRMIYLNVSIISQLLTILMVRLFWMGS